MPSSVRVKVLLASTMLFAGAHVAFAQQEEVKEMKGEPPNDEIIVVGTQIKGAKATAALPVTVVDRKDLDAIGAVSAGEIFRDLPAQGATNFAGDNETGGINGARGDVASINLRSLGTGNTLVLLNGRRLVLHPGTKSENLVPVVTPNLNALPAGGINRVEVLRDGASAIYGADAVGGVINTVLRDHYDGAQLTTRYGDYTGINADMFQMSAYGGAKLGRNSDLTVYASYLHRGGMLASERPYSANDDRRPLVVGTDFEGDTNFRNLSTNTAWGQFDTTQRVRQNGTSLTSSAGRFHIQPTSYPGCLADLGNNLCIDNSSLNSDLRHNTAIFDQPYSDLRRMNAFGFFNHDFENGHEMYAELSFYHSRSDKQREASAPLSSTPITIAPWSYYNPFGAVMLNGQINPNRLAGINAPTAGLPITIGGPSGRYRVIDAGPRQLHVTNFSSRYLLGFRGNISNWDYDSAVLYSRSETNDVTDNRISSTLFQQILNKSTSDAYNPFNGGDPNDVNGGDATPNPMSVISPSLISVRRDSYTNLAMADFKLSNDKLLQLPAGDVGAAFGVELRRIAYFDDRDKRLDGTIKYTDEITGITYDSDVMGSSATPDTKGDRTTFSAWGELFVPIISPEQNIPLFYAVEAQAAGRYEHASDFGDVLVPKLALSWMPFEWLRFRSAYSEGFRAPNLNQVHAEGTQRSNTRTDYYRCQAQINQGIIADMNACGQNQGVLSIRSGSTALKPETNESFTVGAVFQPDKVIPGLAITLDYYHIKQEDVVGIAGDDLQIVLDFVRRLNGDTNAAVHRAAPDPDDITFFAGSGLTPVGSITYVEDPYLNLEKRTSEGLDIGVYYDLDTERFGDFSFKVDATYLGKFTQALSSVGQEIRQEPAANDINLVGEGSLIEQNGQPQWRGLGRVSWRKGPFGLGGSVKYIGHFFDTSAIQNSTGDLWEVKEWITGNAYVQYTWNNPGGGKQFDRLQFRIGANNITDEDPPLADQTYGYFTTYHNARGRLVYGQLRASF